MDLDGLIAFWALVVAAYALLPEYWKFKIKTYIGLSFAFICFILSSLLICVSVLIGNRILLVPLGTTEQVNYVAISSQALQITAYVVLAAFTLGVAYRLKRSKVSVRNVQEFQKYVDSLITHMQYDVLAQALKDNLVRLSSIYNHIPLWLPVLGRLGQLLKGNVLTKEWVDFSFYHGLKFKRSLFTRIEGSIRGLKIPKTMHNILDSTSRSFYSMITSRYSLYRKNKTDHQKIVVKVIDRLIRDGEVTKNLMRIDINIIFDLIRTSKSLEDDPIGYKVIEDCLEYTLKEAMRQGNSQLHIGLQHVEMYGIDEINNSEILNYLYNQFPIQSLTTIGLFVWRNIRSRESLGASEISYTVEPIFDENSDPVFVGMRFFDTFAKKSLLENRWGPWACYTYHISWAEEMLQILRANLLSSEYRKQYKIKVFPLLKDIMHRALSWYVFAAENKLDIEFETEEEVHPLFYKCLLQEEARAITPLLCKICAAENLALEFKNRIMQEWWRSYFILKSSGSEKYLKLADFLLRCMCDARDCELDNAKTDSSPDLYMLCIAAYNLLSLEISATYLYDERPNKWHLENCSINTAIYNAAVKLLRARIKRRLTSVIKENKNIKDILGELGQTLGFNCTVMNGRIIIEGFPDDSNVLCELDSKVEDRL
jgi:hypothetical protein